MANSISNESSKDFNLKHLAFELGEIWDRLVAIDSFISLLIIYMQTKFEEDSDSSLHGAYLLLTNLHHSIKNELSATDDLKLKTNILINER